MQVFEAFLSCGSICTDTRSIVPGSVFFALKGVSFNGNTFALQALEAGAAFAVVDENVGDDERLIKVSDVLTALQGCALDYRRHLNIPTIGLTGSNGKTTTKELFLAVLKTKYKLPAIPQIRSHQLCENRIVDDSLRKTVYDDRPHP